MKIPLVRIDSRLSHGKVVEIWCEKYGIDKVIIANDRVATDDFRQEVMNLTIPENIEATYLKVADVKAFLEKNPGDYFTIVESPEDLEKIADSGIKIEKLNIGIIHMQEGKKSLTEEVAVDDNDLRIFKKLKEAGTEIAVRLSPFASKKSLDEFFLQ